MPRLTERQTSEAVRLHFGIHRRSATVRQVWQHRDGRLVQYDDDRNEKTAFVYPGEAPQAELLVAFGLSETFSVRPGQANSEETEARVAQLRAKTETMKAPE